MFLFSSLLSCPHSLSVQTMVPPELNNSSPVRPYHSSALWGRTRSLYVGRTPRFQPISVATFLSAYHSCMTSLWDSNVSELLHVCSFLTIMCLLPMCAPWVSLIGNMTLLQSDDLHSIYSLDNGLGSLIHACLWNVGPMRELASI